jgi:hypothetical protein
MSRCSASSAFLSPSTINLHSFKSKLSNHTLLKQLPSFTFHFQPLINYQTQPNPTNQPTVNMQFNVIAIVIAAMAASANAVS